MRHTNSGVVHLSLLPWNPSRSVLRFEVQDSGPGVDSERIPALFEPYARFGDITPDASGTGLGLAVVRSVLELLGGSVSVTSEAGLGTTFTIDIPVEPVRAASNEFPRILVMSADRISAPQLDALRALLVHCDVARSPAHAANLLGTAHYDIVFLDLDMPTRNGLDVARDTRRGGGPNAGSRMISMSAQVAVPHWPFEAHLTKPLSLQAIQDTLTKVSTP